MLGDLIAEGASDRADVLAVRVGALTEMSGMNKLHAAAIAVGWHL